MVFLIILILLFAAAIIAISVWGYNMSAGADMTCLLVIIVSAMVLVSIPFTRSSQGAFIKELEVFRILLADSRENKPELQKEAILKEMIRVNSKLAQLKYYNRTFWGDIFVREEVEEIPYLDWSKGGDPVNNQLQ